MNDATGSSPLGTGNEPPTAPTDARRSLDGTGYWLLTAGVLMFGFIGIYSIGLPFLALGVVMTVFGGIRGGGQALWPPLVALVLFVGVFFAIGPGSCSGEATIRISTTGEVTEEGAAKCDRLLLPDYVGKSTPSPWWTILSAAAVGLGAGALLRRAIVRRRAARRSA